MGNDLYNRMLIVGAALVLGGPASAQDKPFFPPFGLDLTAAVRAVSRPGDFWISDNPFAVAAADRDIPGPLVDTSRQRTAAGLLTTADLEAARVRYDVRWLLADSFRLDHVPGFREWRDSRFHAVQNLGGGAVIYEANLP